MVPKDERNAICKGALVCIRKFERTLNNASFSLCFFFLVILIISFNWIYSQRMWLTQDLQELNPSDTWRFIPLKFKVAFCISMVPPVIWQLMCGHYFSGVYDTLVIIMFISNIM